MQSHHAAEDFSQRESKEKRAFDILTPESVLFNKSVLLSSPEKNKIKRLVLTLGEFTMMDGFFF